MPILSHKWTEYPAKMQDILDHFTRKPDERKLFIACESKADAYALRARIYRFFRAIREANREADELNIGRPERVAVGLHAAVQIQRNVLVAASKEPPWGVQVRLPSWADPIRVMTIEEAYRGQALGKSSADYARDQAVAQDEAAFKRIAAGSSTREAPLPTLAQIAAPTCRVTELPCTKKPLCAKKCVLSGEALPTS